MATSKTLKSCASCLFLSPVQPAGRLLPSQLSRACVIVRPTSRQQFNPCTCTLLANALYASSRTYTHLDK
eukprot:983011-Pelagomonas_calceolata.AAC.3